MQSMAHMGRCAKLHWEGPFLTKYVNNGIVCLLNIFCVIVLSEKEAVLSSQYRLL